MSTTLIYALAFAAARVAARGATLSARLPATFESKEGLRGSAGFGFTARFYAGDRVQIGSTGDGED